MDNRSVYLSRLPHGEPFRFVSELHTIESGVAATGQWRVTSEEDFLRGHFPGRPIVPGVLITEALAQLSGIVGLSQKPGDDAQGVLVHTDIRFRSMVEPPATITLRSRQVRLLGTIGQFEVRAEVEGRLVAEGSLAVARPRVNEG